MIWDAVVPGALDRLAADAGVAQIMEDRIFLRTGGDNDPERRFEVPSIEAFVITDAEDEVENDLTVQVDIFTRTRADSVAVEKRVRALLHHDVPIQIAGRGVWSQMQDRRRVPGTGGEIYGVSLDFLMQAVRDRYQREE